MRWLSNQFNEKYDLKNWTQEMVTLIILILVALIVFTLGIAIRYFGCYWLIAGYNTEPPERQEKYDIVPLSRLVGNGLFAIGTLLLAGGIFQFVGYELAFTITMVGLVIPIAYIIIKGRQYSPDG
jgi:hypothetical protein